MPIVRTRSGKIPILTIQRDMIPIGMSMKGDASLSALCCSFLGLPANTTPYALVKQKRASAPTNARPANEKT